MSDKLPSEPRSLGPRKILSVFIEKIGNDDLPTHSAALAYYGLLSLAPLSVGAILIWSFFPLTSSEELIIYIKQLLGPQAADAMRVVLAQAKQPNLRAWAGIFTVLTILVFGTTVFTQLQTSLDHIWKRSSSSIVRNWFIQRLLSMVLFFGSLSFLLICSLSTSIFKALEHYTGILILPVIPVMIGIFFAAGVSAIYRWLSRGRIPWAAAFQAGILTALLFDLGKFLFQIYVKEAAIGSAYGVAGALIVFPLWIFYSSLIFLLGAEVAFILKDRPLIWISTIKNKRWYQKHSKLFWISASIIGATLLIRILIPDFIKYSVNKELDASKEWKGYIEDIDLAVLRGAVIAKNMQLIEKRNEETKLEIKYLTLNIGWLGLLKKELHVDMRVSGGLVTIKTGTATPTEPIKIEKIEEARQAAQTEWPIFINAVKIEKLNIQIQDFTENALPVFHIRDFNLIAENIWNQVEKQEGPSNVNFSATTSGSGKINGKMWLSIFAETPNFKAQVQLKEMDLKPLNPFFRKVANFDLQKGKLDIYSEFASKSWSIDGYLKPLLSDIDFIDMKNQKEGRSVWRAMWEGLLQFGANLLKNPNTKDIAAKITFSGRLDGPGTSPWAAFISIIRNAFVKALGSEFDRDLKIKPNFPPPKK